MSGVLNLSKERQAEGLEFVSLLPSFFSYVALIFEVTLANMMPAFLKVYLFDFCSAENWTQGFVYTR